MRKRVTSVLLIIFSFLLVGCFPTDTSTPCTQCIKIINWQFLKANFRGAPCVTGTARNDFPYALSYVEIFAHFYDEDDIEIGAYWHTMAGVLPGEEWSFEIECPVATVWPYVHHASVEIHDCTAE